MQTVVLRRGLLMDDDVADDLDQCGACGCTQCRLDEELGSVGRARARDSAHAGPGSRPPRRLRPTASLPAVRPARYPYPPS